MRGCGGGHAGFDVAHWWLAEEAAVLAIELAGAFIANFEGCAGGVEAIVEHAFARDVQSQLLLILERAHSSERTELVVECGNAHARHGGEVLDAEGSRVVEPDPFDSFGGAVTLVAEGGDGAEMLALWAAEKAEGNFTLDQTAEEWDVVRSVEKVDEASACVEEFE